MSTETRCSCETPHAAHTFGGRPMQLCKGIPEPDCLDDDEDEVLCITCGQPVIDGGGLYCSFFCESLGNPDGGF